MAVPVALSIGSPMGAALGVIADRLLPEPPNRWHPVAWFGTAMTAVEDRVYGDNHVSGLAYTGVGVGLGVVVGLAVDRLLPPPFGVALSTTVAVGGSMLGATGQAIADLLLADDLDRAREALPALVGRDPTELGPTDISRAVIESLAENAVDAVVAPAVFGAIGGSPAVLAHRAINTMDAMVGHRSARYQRFGWASARLDDAANFVPARLTALAVATVRPSRAADVLRCVRRDSAQHPSPNGGVAEAAFAGALDCRLGGTNAYGDVVEDRGFLGAGAPPAPEDVERADALLRQVSLLTATVLFVGGLAAKRMGTGDGKGCWGWAMNHE